MKSEILLAIIIGLIVGLAVTFSVYLARRQKPITNSTVVVDETSSPSPNSVSELANFTVIAPQEGAVITASELLVTGTADPNSFVAVFIGDEEIITTADETGNFSVEVSLAEGGSVIVIQTINEDGQTAKIERAVARVANDQ